MAQQGVVNKEQQLNAGKNELSRLQGSGCFG